MKKFWLVLLSLGLIAAFSTSALAVDVKVAGDFYVGGLYLNKTDLNSSRSQHPNKGADQNFDLSTAFFYQKLRIGTDFVVSPSLKLVTRFDAMERIWGGTRANIWQANNVMPEYSAGTRNESENIAFDNVYIDYMSPVGQFQVGYMPDSTWGTVFGNMSMDANRGMIKWALPIKDTGFVIVANYAKIEDNSSSAVSTQSWNDKVGYDATRTDRDADSYRVGGIYNFKGDKASGQVGALLIYTRDASTRGNWQYYGDKEDGATGWPYKTKIYNINPYAKVNIGPVALQAELNYAFGDAKMEGYASIPSADPDDQPGNKKIDSLSVFLDAASNIGMFNVGGSFAYVQGDKNPYDDKIHNANTGGVDWNPCLLLFNSETVNYWIGEVSGHNYANLNGPMTNAWFFQGRVGVKPTAQWDVLLSVSYASADKKHLDPNLPGKAPKYYMNSTYGTEIDLVSTYKITNNLSYMLGFGYLFTGDYFKGAQFPDGRAPFEVSDNFIVLNKLTLSF